MPDNENKGPKRNRWTPDGGSGGTGTPRQRFSPWLAIPLLFFGLLIFKSWLTSANTTPLSYSQFITHVNDGSLSGTINIGSSDISGSFKNGSGEIVNFTTTISTNFQTDIAFTQYLDSKHVSYEFTTPSIWTSLLINILPFALVMILIYYFVFKRMGSGASAALNLGRNKVKIYDRKEMKTNFNDVAGVDEAKEELGEIVDFLKNPKKYQRLGGRIPKGVLLLGPPGCGKTLLARAVAGEANVPFFFMSGSEFVEMFVGLGAARVRELFQQAKEKAPALIFLDEIDTIGKGRAGAMGAGFGGHDEREQTLNQLLVEMDGFDSSKGVIIMAATNRPDVLDAALVRPGRFDRQVVVDRPDLRGREEILRVHARGVALDPDVQLRTIASRTPGFTGADLENVVNEAALLAARREKNSVTEEELEEAIDRASMGLERRSRVMSEKERIRVASHEMGHALVAHYSENLDPVHRITIIPRGTAALGLTMVRPLEDRYLATEPELKDMLAFAMGGRVAEELCFAEVSTGAQNDLERATQVARAMVAEYGMSEKVGPLSLGQEDASSMFNAPKISGHTAELIDQEVNRLLNQAHDRAERILIERRDLLNKLSALLLVTETLDGEELEAYASGTKPIPDPASVQPNGKAHQTQVREDAALATAGGSTPPTPPMPADD
ncbi:MAG: ATP-dependent zinc metalloprotease FtsH [Actinomycetota bacterium]